MTTNTGNLTEKVSVNINTTTLAAIDLAALQQVNPEVIGHYFNRSDFINQALREAIARNEANIQRASEESGKKLTGGYWFMGVSRLTEPEVDEILRSGKPRSISGYGVLSVDPNIPAISEISIRGKVSCSPEVREHYNL